MANDKWLYCNDDWFDLINVIKLVKNCDDRLSEFHDMLKRDDMTIKDVIDEWYVIAGKSNIMSYVNEWFYNYDLQEGIDLGHVIYWFFNIYTGEAVHVKYSVSVSCSDIITN